jgi:hypothetical protein
MNDLIDNIYKMIRIHEENNYFSKAPEIVLLCTPEYYHKTIRAEKDQRIYYLGNDIGKDFLRLEIIGLRVPLVIDSELKDNIQYTLMFREDYERLEKEKMYKRFLDMWD